MAEFCVHEQHGGICEKTGTYCNLGACPYEDLQEFGPVAHGHWVGLEYDGYADGFPVYDLWECSECGEEVRGEDVPQTHPYCHGCGARMDGGAA